MNLLGFNRKLVFLWAAAGLLLCVACGGDRIPRGVMTEQQMVDFLTEAYQIEGFYAIETGYHPETLTDDIIGSYHELLERQGVSREKFERSSDYYMHHPDRYKNIHEQVMQRMDDHIAAINEEMSATTDTATTTAENSPATDQVDNHEQITPNEKGLQSTHKPMKIQKDRMPLATGGTLPKTGNGMAKQLPKKGNKVILNGKNQPLKKSIRDSALSLQPSGASLPE